MIKNIRKNILSANIGSSELENIESTYRQFMNKMSLKRSTWNIIFFLIFPHPLHWYKPYFVLIHYIYVTQKFAYLY